MRTTIIAEFGSSPMPAWSFARWCAAAANAGADSVKIQLWRTDSLYPPHMRAAMRDREFPRERLAEFVRTAHAYGLVAGASVFDAQAVTLAAGCCDHLKLAASQQRNSELGMQVSRTRKRTFRSVSEKLAIRDLDFGLNGGAYLFAIPRYPAPMMLSLWLLFLWSVYGRQYLSRWGWSSHTTGYLDCVIAARLGAVVIEKHFAMSPADCEAPHSLMPAQFAKMVRSIRKGE